MMTGISEKDKPTSSLEDYLEAIVMLKEQGEKATVTALSQSVGVKKPSVDWALKKLGDAGLIIHEKYGDVELTPEGARIADEVYHHHKIIRQFLVEILNVDPETADNDACRMEHVLSRKSLARLEKFIDFVLNCPRGEPEWLKGFKYYFERGERNEELLARCQREASGKD
jgi:DtxR family Mn-dependent transcriptional regulator